MTGSDQAVIDRYGNRLSELAQCYLNADQRMVDLPFYNPKLKVELRGFRLWLSEPEGDNPVSGIGLTGVLITPWCMNLVFLPVGDDLVTESLQSDSNPSVEIRNSRARSSRESAGCASGPSVNQGNKHLLALPGGDFELVAGSQEETGIFYSASLFSPMADFDSQGFALDVADEVIRQIFPSVAESINQADDQWRNHADTASVNRKNSSPAPADSNTGSDNRSEDKEKSAVKPKGEVNMSRRHFFGLGRKSEQIQYKADQRQIASAHPEADIELRADTESGSKIGPAQDSDHV
nr:[NiFe]-hydrogenase assembly chaperone HybE [Oceanospirillum sediminis]